MGGLQSERLRKQNWTKWLSSAQTGALQEKLAQCLTLDIAISSSVSQTLDPSNLQRVLLIY